MELERIRVGFPILKLGVQIIHATPRHATAFEKVLLDLCFRFRGNNQQTALTLDAVFRNILGVSSPSAFVSSAIDELIGLNVLRCDKDINAYEKIQISDLTLTELGKSMASSGLLPAKPYTQDMELCYDPIKDKLLTESEKNTLSSNAPAISLDAGLFSGVFPEEGIRKYISNCDWLRKDSQIESVMLTSEAIAWRSFPATVEMNDNIMSIVLKDTAQNKYIGELNADDVYSRFIKPVFSHPVESLLETVENVPQDDNATPKYTSITKAVEDFEKQEAQSSLLLTDGYRNISSFVSYEPKTGQIVLIFNPTNKDEVDIKWNTAHDGCIVDIKGVFGGLLASKRSFVRAMNVTVKIGHESYQIPLAVFNQGELDTTRILPAITDDLFKKSEADALKFQAIWEKNLLKKTDKKTNEVSTSSDVSAEIADMRPAMEDTSHAMEAFSVSDYTGKYYSDLESRLFQLGAKGKKLDNYINNLTQRGLINDDTHNICRDFLRSYSAIISATFEELPEDERDKQLTEYYALYRSIVEKLRDIKKG
ncbi:hypothetical protein AGMMS50276_08440 [Synergistales bacterium]|nr:hypothetical protein AGMMS50276_08440 [Synergistales bacterium]